MYNHSWYMVCPPYIRSLWVWKHSYLHKHFLFPEAEGGLVLLQCHSASKRQYCFLKNWPQTVRLRSRYIRAGQGWGVVVQLSCRILQCYPFLKASFFLRVPWQWQKWLWTLYRWVEGSYLSSIPIITLMFFSLWYIYPQGMVAPKTSIHSPSLASIDHVLSPGPGSYI